MAEYLLAHGHTQALSYVLRQAVAFHYLANRRERKEMIEEMGLLRVAYHADQKQYQKTLKSLE